ncbi:hypothetical protein ACIBHX_42800 [Nonomuraea sp. NPDC050536]|uniref:hypothetical protein n=1 Tax=Nonomuraea sp. NPDC050536 TaxID=3364366 RepID=UPI0037C4FE69
MVMVLRNNTLALLQLDADAYELPGGVRRWPVYWDDLLVYAMESETPADGYRLGLSGEDRQAVQHAVPHDAMISLCGEPVRWLPICGRSIRFSPRALHACPECVHLATLP